MGGSLVDGSMSGVRITAAHEQVSRSATEDGDRAHEPCHVRGLAAVVGAGGCPSSSCCCRDGTGGSRYGGAKGGSEHGDMYVWM